MEGRKMHLKKIVAYLPALALCAGSLAACASIEEPFVSANLGIVPDAGQNLSIAAEDSAAASEPTSAALGMRQPQEGRSSCRQRCSSHPVRSRRRTFKLLTN